MLLHTGRSTLSMQTASSYLWMVEREMRSNCRNDFSLSFVLFGCFSPKHACMDVCVLSLSCIKASRLFLKTCSIFWVFLNQYTIYQYITFIEVVFDDFFCYVCPLKFQCTQALEKPLFECLCFLCWAVYFAFFPHSSRASLWQLLFCMNYIPRGRKSPNSSSRFDSCLCD